MDCAGGSGEATCGGANGACGADVEGRGGAVCAAAMETAPNKRRKRIIISVASRRSVLRLARYNHAGKIDGRSRAQQHGRHTILRRALRSRVAAHAVALLAAPNPEPSVLLTQNSAFFVEQSEANRLVCRSLHKKRTIRLNRRRARNDCVALSVQRLQPHRCGSYVEIALA